MEHIDTEAPLDGSARNASATERETSGRDADRSVLGGALLLVCALGLVLRAIHLDVPMRYDETVTYGSYASQGWEHVTTHYEHPNNHVLHTLLVSWLTGWLGNAPVVIRLPAFLAGCLLIPGAAWVGHRLHGREAGLIAAAVVATSPVLVEFSTNARGYTLVALSVLLAVGAGTRLLDRGGGIWWVVLVASGVIGLYTVPTMAVAWTGITLWLAVGLVRVGGSPWTRARNLIPLIGANAAVAALSAALYWGIVSNHGLEALTRNRFVVAEPLGTFLLDGPWALAAVLAHWARGVPPVLVALGAGSVVAGLYLGRRSTRLPALFGALLLGALLVMLTKRNWGEPRIWLWMAPLLAVAVGVGLVEAARRIPRATILPASLLAAAGWAGWMSVHLVLARPVRASEETGALPQGEEVVAGITERYRLGDGLVTDFVTAEPLRYYLRRYVESGDVPPASQIQRSWIVLDRGDSIRAERVRRRVARMGAPPLHESEPAFTTGDVAVYLYGRRAASADPRLLEAIDLYTGVAGVVDDARARALLLEVAEETRSALSRMWVARCHSRGRMGFLQDESRAREIAAEVISDIRELAAVGEVEAIFLVGTAYDEALGLDADPEEAVRWYRRAAEAGHVLGAHNLGNAYAAGRGVERDDAEAVRWWRQAAEEGDAITQLRLGEAYEAGRGVGRDPARAAEWYRRSAERGNRDARQALEKLVRGG